MATKKVDKIKMIFMTAIQIKKIQFLIKKNLMINFLKLMAMDFGLDICPHIHLECLAGKMLLGISFQD